MFLLTWPIDLGAAAESRGWLPFHIPFLASLLVGYGFVIASLLVTGLAEGRAGIRALLRRFLIWRVAPRWYAVVLLGPFALALAALAITLPLVGPPDLKQTMAHTLAGPLSLGLFAPLFLLIDTLSNGEEIGWRGYLLPRMRVRWGALAASIVIGVVWAAWHIPKFLGAGGAPPVPAGLFLLDFVAASILYTWVANGTRDSLLLVTLLHAASNTAAVCLLPTAGPYMITYAILRCVAALVVVLLAGPNLARTPGTARTSAAILGTRTR
jgi:membrane protease YdiL (CAAX protease family)